MLTSLSVSVVIPTFNRKETVCRAIECALKQTHKPTEVIVVDDGSSDGTEEKVNLIFGDRIKYLKQKNAGVSSARNFGIRNAQCDLIAFLDSDDFWECHKLEYQLPTMLNRDVVLSATNWRWEDERNGNRFQELGLNIIEGDSIEDFPIGRLTHPKGHGLLIQSCICRRNILQELGGFDQSLRISEDNDLIFRIATKGKFCVIPKVLLIRDRSDKLEHLTNTSSLDWKRENLDNMLRIVSRSIQDARNYPSEKRRVVSKRYTRLLLDRAKVSVQAGDPDEARHFALSALLCSTGSFRNAFSALALLIWPGIRAKPR
jgi:glycosyltransferase involved in cell wall biosynthesis